MNYNIKYAEQGLCGYCGKNKPEEGIKKCSICKHKNLEAQKRTRQKRIEQGICVYCGKNKAETDHKGCDTCNKNNAARSLKYQKANHEKEKNRQAKNGKKRREHRLKNKLCTQCGKPAKEGHKYCEDCLIYRVEAQKLYIKRHPEKAREYRQRVRSEVIAKYGGLCDCCGEDRIEFLAIDHKNGDGHAERKKLNGKNITCTSAWYGMLRREPKRDDLRVLCHNCNMATAFYGACPHELERKNDSN